ncbi:MFS transporter [Streptomyces flaveolus]|uniref:MFS transporter n=1 Tax=Streptomyces flaveolus TaxID=67297 RepID=A0ABV1VII5_9ACTN
MGLGVAMIMPGTLATITGAFPPEQRVKGVATWSGFAAAGAVVGMLASGALLEWFSERSIVSESTSGPPRTTSRSPTPRLTVPGTGVSREPAAVSAPKSSAPRSAAAANR